MDTTYMSQLMLSIAIFAPGLILLAGLGFVGLMMLLERTVLRGKVEPVVPQQQDVVAGNPEPGPVVQGLKDSLQTPMASATQEEPAQAERKQANG